MDTIKNVTQLLIGKDVAESAIVDLVLVTSGSQFNDGEIFITDAVNRYLDGSSAAVDGLIKYGQARGSEILWSDIIDLKNNLRSYAIGSGADETQQLDYIGWNGVAGALDTLASNIYTVRLNILDKNIAGFMQQKIKEGFYKSNANAASYTQSAIALGLQKSLVANYSRETEQDLAFERVNGGATLATLGNLSVTKGSKFFTDATDDTLTILVGSLVRTTTALTSPTYVVVGHDSGVGVARVYELDIAYQGATATLTDAETVTEAGWGVKIQGVNREFKAGYYWSNVIFWETQIDFGELAGTALVTSTAAYPGVGTGNYIANLEGELQADEHIYRSFVEGGVVNRTDAELSNLGIYDVQVIEHDHQLDAAQGTPTHSPKTLMVAWRDTTNANAVAVVAIQELLFTAASVTYTAQGGNLT